LEYKMESTDFNSYLHQTIEDLKHLIPYHKLHTNFALTMTLSIDQLRIEQVLSNLLSNAAKYSAHQTNIYINTCVEEDARLVVLSVTDEGIGIDEEGLIKVFEKFHRQAEVIGKQSGLGMGMYIASEIIHAHSGKIWVDSKKGIGSTFYISLPLPEIHY
jgi:signal transduction histidine kinase